MDEIKNINPDIMAFLGGDNKAFSRILDKNKTHVAKLAWRFTRNTQEHKELVHDVFVQIALSLHTYQPIAPFEHWIARITLRMGYKLWKYKKRHSILFFENNLPDLEIIEDKTVENHDKEKILHYLLAFLNVNDRMVLTLMYYENKRIKEIAEIMQWSEVAIRQRISRARKKLKKLCDKKGLTEEMKNGI